MKKLALVLAIAMIAAFSAPAMAVDVKIGGEFRTLGVYYDNGWTMPVGSSVQGTSQFINQRLRLPVTFNVNDNVKVFLRVDIAETVWGVDNAPNVLGTMYTQGDAWRRPNAYNTSFDVDRAYAMIKSGIFTLQAGQQFGFVGLGSIFDSNFFGFKGSLNLSPVTIDMYYSKLDEGANTMAGGYWRNMTDANRVDDDEDVYLMQVKYAADNFTIGGIVGRRVDQNGFAVPAPGAAATQLETTAYGLFATTKLGIVSLKAEFDLFTGEVDFADGTHTDVTGQQFFLSASLPVNDWITVGGDFLWAKAPDNNEIQATNLASFGVIFSPLEFEGTLVATVGGYGGARLFSQTNTNAYGSTGLGTGQHGVIGLVARSKFLLSDSLTFWAKAAYLEPEGNQNDTNRQDSTLYFISELDYQWMPNVVIGLGANYVVPDFNAGPAGAAAVNDDEHLLLMAKLGVNF